MKNFFTNAIVLLIITLGVALFLFKVTSLLPFFLLICFFLGFDICYVNLKSFFTSVCSIFWPQSQGFLIDLKSEKIHQNGMRKYVLNVHYGYIVNEKEYIGETFTWSGYVSSSEEKVNSIISSLKSSENFKVYFNPQNPSESVLKPSVNLVSIIGFFVGISLVVASFYYQLTVGFSTFNEFFL